MQRVIPLGFSLLYSYYPLALGNIFRLDFITVVVVFLFLLSIFFLLYSQIISNLLLLFKHVFLNQQQLGSEKLVMLWNKSDEVTDINCSCLRYWKMWEHKVHEHGDMQDTWTGGYVDCKEDAQPDQQVCKAGEYVGMYAFFFINNQKFKQSPRKSPIC